MVKYTNEKMNKALKRYLVQVSKKFDIEKVILFGSRARGDFFLNSDVDLILVSKDFENFTFRKRMVEVIGYWDEYIDLEVICYTPEEFEKMKKRIGIVRQAVLEGVEVVF